MTIIIEKIDNGYYLEEVCTAREIEGGAIPFREAIEEVDNVEDHTRDFKTNSESKIALGRILMRAAEKLCDWDDKDDKYKADNLNITFDRKGHKIK